MPLPATGSPICLWQNGNERYLTFGDEALPGTEPGIVIMSSYANLICTCTEWTLAAMNHRQPVLAKYVDTYAGSPELALYAAPPGAA